MIEHLQSRMKDDVNGEHAPSNTTGFPFHVYTQHHAPPLGDTKSKRKIHELDRLGKSQSCDGGFYVFPWVGARSIPFFHSRQSKTARELFTQSFNVHWW